MTDHTPEQQEAEELLGTAKLARTVSRKALQLALTQIRDGTVKDPSTVARNAAVVAGITHEKRNLLLDRPTQITAGHVDPRIGAGILAQRLGVVVDSTAEDITPAPELPPN